MKVSRKQAFSNFGWKLAEQMGAQLVSFIVAIVLARLLMPEDYVCVSVIAILSTFCAVFIDGGLSKSLIQKKNADIVDFSTVLYVSIGLAALVYCILFISAPFIAGLYKNELLVPVIRVYSIVLFVGAFNTVQSAYISKHLQFKKYFMATIIGTIVSAVVGIWMAYSGYGPWALVAQQMINPIIDTIILYVTSSFRPKLCFSFSKLKELWSFGIRVLGTSLVDMLYDNIRPLIVGIKFNSADLAFYQKGRSYPDIINSTLNSTLASVLFPVMATVQEDLSQVKVITKKYIRTASYMLFPVLLGLAAIAPNLIVWMITDKWIKAIPYMQIFCVNYMFQLLQSGNLQAINAVGRSDIVFKLAIVKKSINFILLFIFIIFANSPLLLAGLGILTSLIAYIINISANRKILQYGFWEQLGDIVPNLLSAILMAVIVYLIGKINAPLLPMICLQIVVGGVIYVAISIVTHNPTLSYCIDTIKSYMNK